MHDNNETGEKKILSHEPVPGYRTVFLIVFTIGLLYQGLILFKTL